MLTWPCPSTPMTPALAPASTASVKRRRLSMTSRARMMSSCWVRSSWVMRLKVSPRLARSPSDWRTGTRTYRLPVETRLAAPIRRRIGATSRLAKLSPIQTADSSTISAITVYISAKATCTPSRRASSCGVFGDALARRLQLRHHARIEQPRHVEIVVVVFLQLDDGGDVIGVGQQHDLRLLGADVRQRVARRDGEGLVGLEVGARDHVEVLVEHDGRGEAAHRGLEGEELVQLGLSSLKTGSARARSNAITMMSERTIWAWSRR